MTPRPRRGFAPPTQCTQRSSDLPTATILGHGRRSRACPGLLSGNAKRFRRQGSSETFDDACDGLAEADAHAGDAVARVPPLELVQQRRCHAGARRAERVTERDAAAVRIDVVPAVL